MKKILFIFALLLTQTQLQANPTFKLDLEGSFVPVQYKRLNHVVQGLKGVTGIGFIINSIYDFEKVCNPEYQNAYGYKSKYSGKQRLEFLSSATFKSGLGLIFTLASYEYFKKLYAK